MEQIDGGCAIRRADLGYYPPEYPSIRSGTACVINIEISVRDGGMEF